MACDSTLHCDAMIYCINVKHIGTYLDKIVCTCAEHDDNKDTQDNEIVNADLDDNRNSDDRDDDNSEDEVDSYKNDDGNGEYQADSDDNVDEPACDFDTEWHELQDIVNLTEEKFRTFWKDEHFQKAFKNLKQAPTRHGSDSSLSK